MEKFLMGNYDVVVVGAGHAGCEAGLAAARMGMKTLMLSINLEACLLYTSHRNALRMYFSKNTYENSF